MAKDIEDLNLDERFTGSHFHENSECGTAGKIVARLMRDNQGEKPHKNIHVQLLRVLKNANLENLLDLLKQNPPDKENRKDALAYWLRKEGTDKDCYYYNQDVLHYGRKESLEVAVGLPAQRVIVRGREGAISCCELVEKLLGDEIIESLERLIIHGIGEPTTQPRGLLMQLKDKNKEGETMPEVIKRFREANKGNGGALVISNEGWERLKRKIESEKLTKDENGIEILCETVKVWISHGMPENIAAVINTKDVYLAFRYNPNMNNWWNYKESMASEICWKYRYACNLVVEHPRAAIKIDIGGLK